MAQHQWVRRPGWRVAAAADRLIHRLGLRVPLVCGWHDWALGLTWREVRR